MANIADCAVAIEKDERKLDEFGLTRTTLKDGYDLRYKYSTKDGHKVSVVEVRNGESFSKTISVDGKQASELPRDSIMDTDTYKETRNIAISNGWRLDFLKAKFYSYDAPIDIREYEDHITIYFGGRWCFPEELENRLNDLDLAWQGADAEGGCEVLCDEYGNTDFGLRAIKRKADDDEDYDDYWVEDTTNGGKNLDEQGE